MHTSDYSPVSKSALYLRHSVCGAWASDRYCALQDISGEFHVCQLDTLGLMYTLYSGMCTKEQIALNDEICCFIEGPILHVTDMPTGHYIIKQLTH